MKKTLLVGVIAMALACCMALVACSGGSSSSGGSNGGSAPAAAPAPDPAPAAPATEVTFTNNCGERVGSLYLTSPEEEEWGDPLIQGIDNGASVIIDLGVTEAGVYDFACVDNTGWNYDFFGVTIAPGDSMELLGDGTLTIGGAKYICEPYLQ